MIHEAGNVPASTGGGTGWGVWEKAAAAQRNARRLKVIGNPKKKGQGMVPALSVNGLALELVAQGELHDTRAAIGSGRAGAGSA